MRPLACVFRAGRDSWGWGAEQKQSRGVRSSRMVGSRHGWRREEACVIEVTVARMHKTRRRQGPLPGQNRGPVDEGNCDQKDKLGQGCWGLKYLARRLQLYPQTWSMH